MIHLDERRHLLQGPRSDESPGGAGLVELIATGSDARSILEQGREVLLVVLDRAGLPWPELGEWRRLLPEWFVAACAPERSQQEAQQWLAWWRSLAPSEQVRAEREQRWALADWLYWMHPDNREWFWWDAHIESYDTVRAHVEIDGWPAPLGALEWLLRAAGAAEVRLEEQLAR